jgi:hypothetical protein
VKINWRTRYSRPIARGIAAVLVLFWATMLVLDFVAPPGGPLVVTLFAVVDSLFLSYYSWLFLRHDAIVARMERAEAIRNRYRAGEQHALDFDKEV